LDRHRYAGVVATSPENLLYLTGYQVFQGVWNRFPRAAIFAPDAKRIALVLPVAEAGFVIDQGTDQVCDVYVYGKPNVILTEGIELNADEKRIERLVRERSHPDPWSAMAAALEDLNLNSRRIAVDRSGVPATVEHLAHRVPGLDVTGGGEDLLRVTRMVKTATEVNRLQHAVDVNERAIKAMLERLADLDDIALAALHRDAVVSEGGYVQHWTGSPGRHAGMSRYPAGVRAAKGDRWKFDIGIVVDGYCSDLGGTAQVGAPPSAAELHTYEAITAGIDAAVSNARPGLRSSELYQLTLDAVRANGIPDYTYSLVGHGIGVEPRDYPILGPAQKSPSPLLEGAFDPTLEAGMVLNFEVPMSVLGVGGYQHEVTCLITPGGGQLMSSRRSYEVVN
jgi:Xaa-Pro aminopeptidase